VDKVDHIYKLHEILRNRRTPIARSDLRERMGCSMPTIDRAISTMRVRWGAHIEFDRERSGYCYARAADGGTFELPGLWFNAAEQ